MRRTTMLGLAILVAACSDAEEQGPDLTAPVVPPAAADAGPCPALDGCEGDGAMASIQMLDFPDVAGLSTVAWLQGDVFAGIGSGRYGIFDGAGTSKDLVSAGSGFTTGCGFNLDNSALYGTYFSEGNVRVFDAAVPHDLIQTISAETGAESVAFDDAGNFYVGVADGDRDIRKYDASGTLVAQYDVATGRRGSDWIDLAADQETIFYTSEGNRIFRYNVATSTQLSDFASIPTGGAAYALRLLPPGDGSGGLLVAKSQEIYRLDGSGAVVQTYDATGENSWFSLNIDPDGTSFWAGDFSTNRFYQFDIETGAVLVGPVASGGSLFGVCVLGELTAARPTQLQMEVRPTQVSLTQSRMVQVYLLGTPDFDASSAEPADARLVVDGADPGAPVFSIGTRYYSASRDFDGDGDTDRMFYFAVSDLVAAGLTTGVSTLQLQGATGDVQYVGNPVSLPIILP